MSGKGALTAIGIRRREQLAKARLYLILDGYPHRRDPQGLLEAAITSGVDIVQLRDKQLGDDELLAVAAIFKRVCDRRGALFILNDRPDLAVDCAADGAHVGQNDLDAGAARETVGVDLLLGLSTHSPQQIAAADHVDYIGVGPVWATPTKAGRPAVGMELVGVAAAEASVPFFAIGGIEVSNVAAVVAAGARRVAVVRAIRDSADPGAAAVAIAKALPPPGG